MSIARPTHRPARFALERQSMAWPEPTASTPGGAAEAQAPSGSRRALWREILETAFLTVLISVGIHAVIQSRQVEGSSMEPTLQTGERLLINKFAYLGYGEPQRGDIVVFRAWGQQEDFIKRVVGLPGDLIEVHDDSVYVNGHRLTEPYLDQITTGAGRRQRLSEGEYYVLGDNRGNSSDSRLFGALRRGDIIGKALVRYWPFDAATWLAEREPFARAH